MKNKFLLAFLCSSFFHLTLTAQSNLFLDQSYTIEEMVMDFFNHPDITISNVNATGATNSFAFFDAGGTELDVDAGMFFCSGDIENAVGPNSAEGSSSVSGGGNDIDLEQIVGMATNDAFVIEFDFTISNTDSLYFKYSFGSEEYCEYVSSGFNDVFGFFVSGPGINGPYSNNAINIALLENSQDYVGINSINHTMNQTYFMGNSSSCGPNPVDLDNLEYDGLTTKLTAPFLAEAGNTYHVKLAIADVADAIFDSGIFLEYSSLSEATFLAPFTEFSIAPSGNIVSFTNDSKYARSWFWDFGNGETSDLRNPPPVTYATDNTYTATLTTENYCCTETFTHTFTIGNPTSVNEHNDFDISIYPNPVEDHFFLDLPQELTDVETVQVYDVLGQEKRSSFDQQSNTMTVQLGNNLSTGVYYVWVVLEDGKKAVMRFVVK